MHILILQKEERVKSKAHGLAHILILREEERAKSRTHRLAHISTF
jgi:hypothetical protein